MHYLASQAAAATVVSAALQLQARTPAASVTDIPVRLLREPTGAEAAEDVLQLRWHRGLVPHDSSIVGTSRSGGAPKVRSWLSPTRVCLAPLTANASHRNSSKNAPQTSASSKDSVKKSSSRESSNKGDGILFSFEIEDTAEVLAAFAEKLKPSEEDEALSQTAVPVDPLDQLELVAPPPRSPLDMDLLGDNGEEDVMGGSAVQSTRSASSPRLSSRKPEEDELEDEDTEFFGGRQSRPDSSSMNRSEHGGFGSTSVIPNLDKESVSGPDFTPTSPDPMASSHSGVSESVLSAIDMLCDDLFSCKTEVLKSFARVRYIHHGNKSVIVTRLIEKAHADAHGENNDLSVTRRVLGDVFDGDVRVSGVRTAWTNRSLEASHIEAACARHLSFTTLTNSNKTLMVRRHSAETSRMMRKLSRPFQESYEKVSNAALLALEKIMKSDTYYPASPSQPQGIATDGNAPNFHFHPPAEEQSSSKKSSSGAKKTRGEKNASPSGAGDPKQEGSSRTLSPRTFKEIKEELDNFVSQITTTELLSPFIAFLISYIRYGAAPNLLTRVDVNEKLLELGLVVPTIEEEDIEPSATSSGDSSSNLSRTLKGAGNTKKDPLTAVQEEHSLPQKPTQYGQKTLTELMQLFDEIVRQVRKRDAATRIPGCTTAQRIHFDCPELVLVDVENFLSKPTSHWKTAYAPAWVQELARSFLNWEICVRTDLSTFADAPDYVFDAVLSGVIHYQLIEKVYGPETVSPVDINLAVRGAVKKAIDKMFNHEAELVAAASQELITYVNASMDTTKAFSGDFFVQVLSQMKGVLDMGLTPVGNVSAVTEDDDADGFANLEGLDDEAEAAISERDNKRMTSKAENTVKSKRSTSASAHPVASEDETNKLRFQKRVATVLKEIGKTASRCTRSANLLDLLVRVTEDVHFHYRFLRAFNNLDSFDKLTIRGRRCVHLQKTLEYFEKEQGITNPITVEAMAYLVLVLTFFSMRPRDGKPPVLIRYDSVIGEPSLAIVGLREKGETTLKELRVAFPPQLSYRSWLHESDTKEKSVYKVLPSVAVKGPTNEAMIISQAPMMRALDAISKVPWRIHKYLLHVQEAMVREGYGFGKLRPAFYPMHYSNLHPGTVFYKAQQNDVLGDASPIRALAEETPELTEGGEGDGKTSAALRRRERGNEDSMAEGESLSEEDLTADGGVVGCNIKQRMAYDIQQAEDWRALNDVRSSRTHYLQALRQARSIVQFSHLYFPNSMDFRGRMYPLPGRLNHTGSDPFRALLEYADPKPLGAVGLYWLKVHVANKFGMSKLSFDERVHFVEEHTEDVIQSAERPLSTSNTSGQQWWQEAAEPFQCLMACKELADALKYSQGAENFPSRLPVAVDGSYNGLQHYSAIGRDSFGAKLVNLVPSERPADAYTGILQEMLKAIEKEAGQDHPVAQRCLGSGRGQDKNHIKRKTIKRPIMTQVYGVTSYGMAEQIFEELNKQNKAHGLWTLADTKEMANYLKDKVLDSLGVTFRETQRCREWISEVGALVHSAQPAELRNALCWTTPLGLVVRQPYRVHKDSGLFTLQGYTKVPGDSIGAAGRKQLTAMAPNLIHSLDATHLAMTALEMQKEGLSMMAVHDSYWTYACDLPKLSKILRQQFVHLYTQHDPLWELKEQWEEAFFFDLRRHGICLPDPPDRGDLDLKVVLDSPYFFS